MMMDFENTHNILLSGNRNHLETTTYVINIFGKNPQTFSKASYGNDNYLLYSLILYL